MHQEPAVPQSIPQPFAAIARECLRIDPRRRCAVQQIKTRLESPQSNAESVGEAGPAKLAKLRLTAFAAAALVLLLVISAFLLHSHQTRPSPSIGEPQAVSPAAAPSHPSFAAKKQNAKATAVKGAVVNQVLPDVPQTARDTIRGTVIANIRVTVEPDGEVSDAAIESGASKYFSNQALNAARQWRFKPSQADEQSPSRVSLLRFEFTQTATRAYIVR